MSTNIEASRRKAATVSSRVYVGAMAAAAMLIIMYGFYLHAAYSVTLNSDTVNALLQGYSISHGNPLMHGWTFSNISFYTTDLLYYALLTWLSGFHFAILKIGPAIIYTLIVALAAVLAVRGKSHPYWRVAAVVLLIGLPVEDMAITVFSPMDHTNTLAFALGAIICASLYERMPRVAYVLTPMFLAWACVGDTLMVFIGVIPIAFASLMKRKWILAGLSILSVIVAHVATVYIPGYHLYPTYYRFAQLQDLPHHVSYAVYGILSLTGANFFGTSVNLQSLLSAGHLIGTIAILYVACRAVRRWLTLDFIALVLISGMTISLAAFIFSTFPTGDGADRYLLAFVVFGSILVARQFEWLTVTRNIRPRIQYGAFGALALAYLVSFFAFPTPDPNMTQKQVATFLQEHNLTNGYGSYWSANVLTAVSDGAVQVRPVYLPESNKISEYDWESYGGWYRAPANFVVFDGTMGIDEQNVAATFGMDEETYHVGQYTVMVWNGDITPKLNHIALTGGIAWG